MRKAPPAGEAAGDAAPEAEQGAAAGTITSALAFDGIALVRAGDDPLVHAPSGTAVRATPLRDAAPSL